MKSIVAVLLLCVWSTAALELRRPSSQSSNGADTKNATKIPFTLLCTGKPDHFSELSPGEQQNIQHTLSLNDGIKLKYLGDHECYDYLLNHFADIAEIYKNEEVGNFRGDICRTAVLAREGGIYTDLDVAMQVPFSDFHQGANFASAMAKSGQEVLNAVMAVTPGHRIMEFMLEEIQRGVPPNTQVGPAAAFLALHDLQDEACPDVDLYQMDLTHPWQETLTCGAQGTVRMLREKSCRNIAAGCPPGRDSDEWMRYGIYDKDKLVAWSRFEGCTGFGCGGTGHEEHAPALN
jgi:hypothetical protein